MPRTMFVLPTSTTRRFTRDRVTAVGAHGVRPSSGAGARCAPLHQNQLPRAHRHDVRAVAQQRPSLLVDAAPRAAHGALADDAGDAVAAAVDGEAAPLVEDALAVERTPEQ